MSTENCEIPPAASPEPVQRKLEDMGLGTEEKRNYYRALGNWPSYGHLPERETESVSTLQWFPDKRKSALITTEREHA